MSTPYWKKYFFMCPCHKKAWIRSCSLPGAVLYSAHDAVLRVGQRQRGNATIVRAGETVLLVDAGFSAARLRDKMKSAGVEPDELDAILLTHEHADHMKGVHQFTRKHAVRVYATRHTTMCVQEKRRRLLGPILKRGSLSE